MVADDDDLEETFPSLSGYLFINLSNGKKE